MRARSITTLLFSAVVGVFLVLGSGCDETTNLQVNRLSKDKGIAGDQLTIHGAGFQASGARGVKVFFGNSKAKVIRFVGNGQILVEVPGGNEMGKTVDVQLVFEPGGSKRLANAFKYVEISQLEVGDFEKKEGGAKKP